ncbi:MAG TPA: carbohydrate kinase family protein [Solirubrobacteraceae bacterium]|nr:carbohydrate kinase family protein [Solirubrobacteraceae bacterium]
MDLLVVGDLNADLVLRGGEIEPTFDQREQFVDHAELVLGGSGGIMAAGAAKLGLDVAMVGCVGDDPLGTVMIDALAQAGVDTSAVLRTAAAATGISVALARPGDRAILTAAGALAHLQAEDVSRELLARARHVHVASPFLQDGLRPGLQALAGAARSTSLDPGWDPREEWSLPIEAFDVLLPNAEEARRLAGRADGDVEAAARELAARGPTVVVKLGADGAVAVDGGETIRVPAHPVEPVDSTGAGDSFDAGFLAARLSGAGLADAVALGCACGALSTRRSGGTAGQPTLEEARALT